MIPKTVDDFREQKKTIRLKKNLSGLKEKGGWSRNYPVWIKTAKQKRKYDKRYVQE